MNPLTLAPPSTVCWDLKPDTRAINCTNSPGHLGDHAHEYSGQTWPQPKKDQ